MKKKKKKNVELYTEQFEEKYNEICKVNFVCDENWQS